MTNFTKKHSDYTPEQLEKVKSEHNGKKVIGERRRQMAGQKAVIERQYADGTTSMEDEDGKPVSKMPEHKAKPKKVYKSILVQKAEYEREKAEAEAKYEREKAEAEAKAKEEEGKK